MKYEEIKIGDVFRSADGKETVISKSDRYKIITTIDPDTIPTVWEEEDLPSLKPIKEELPEEGLLVSLGGSLAYKLPDGSGYGFVFGDQSSYKFNIGWEFSNGQWKQATPEQKTEFVKMLKTECEKHGLFKDTKLAECGINSTIYNVNKGVYGAIATPHKIWNKNGRIFELGIFATPLKEVPALELVSKAYLDLSKFRIELEQEGNMLVINPIKK